MTRLPRRPARRRGRHLPSLIRATVVGARWPLAGTQCEAWLGRLDRPAGPPGLWPSGTAPPARTRCSVKLRNCQSTSEHANQRISMPPRNVLTQQSKVHRMAATSGCTTQRLARCRGRRCRILHRPAYRSRSGRRDPRSARREVPQPPWTPADPRGSTARKYRNLPGSGQTGVHAAGR
jgi:hypothetical protein